MRLALVISSNYSENNVVPMRESFEDTASLVEARLSVADTDFTVIALKANRDLPEQLDGLLDQHREHLESLFIHFSGYLAVKPDRGPAWLLDGSRLRAFPISRLRASLSQSARQALVILDVHAVADGDVRLDEIAQGLGIALNEVSPHISVLSSVAQSENETADRRGCLRLTDCWLLSLDYHRVRSNKSPVLASTIVQGIQSERLAYASLASFDYQPSELDFVILPLATDSGDDEEPPTIPPNFGKRPSLLDLPLPVPPSLGTSGNPPAVTPGAATQAAYFPSAPPPVVQAKRPSAPPGLPRVLSAPPPPIADARPIASGTASRSNDDLYDVATLERLIEASDQTGDYRESVAQREMLAALLEIVPDQRSHVLFEAANITLRELNDMAKARQLVERAIESDPLNTNAFNLCVEILNRQGQLQEIVNRCSLVLTRLPEPKLRYHASCRLLDLIEIHGTSIEVDPNVLVNLRDAANDDEGLKFRVASILKDHTVYEEAVVSLENVLANDPRHLPSLRALSDAAQRQHDPDTAALASAVLICLQSGRPEDEVRLAKLVTDGLPLARRTLSDQDFEVALIANPENAFLFKTLGRLTKVAIAAGLATNSRYEELPKDATVLDPESSTVTLGRSLAWAAKFVGVATPELVVLPDLATHLELTVNGGDRLLISKQLGSGLSLAQLAFLGARHLSMLRPEFRWRSALDTPERLAAVIGNCARLLREGRDFFKSVGDSERKGAKRFVSQLEADPSLYDQVTRAFGALDVNPAMWDSVARSVLLATDRVLLRDGLLACANPAAAWQLTQQYPLASLLSVDEQLDEIARFATSRDHLALRRSLGLTAMPN